MYICPWCTTLNQDPDKICWQCGVVSCTHCRLTHGSEWLKSTRGLSSLLAHLSSQTRGCLKDLQLELPTIRGDYSPPDWIDIDHFERSLTKTAYEHSGHCPDEGYTEYDRHEDKEEGEFQVPTWLTDMALKLVLAEYHNMGDPDVNSHEEGSDEGANDAVEVWSHFSEIFAPDL